jgi:hypothetical protein
MSSMVHRRIGRGAAATALGRILVVLPLLLVLLAPSQAAASWLRYAVVAGNNRGLAREEALRFAEEDARRVGSLLRSSGNVTDERLVVQTGASKLAFSEAVRGFDGPMGAHARAGDRTLLFVYFSGHSDGKHLQLGDELLPFKEVRDLVASSPATLKVLVVDSCQSGGLTGIKGIVPTPDVDVWLRGQTTASGMVIVTASSVGEVAQESVELGGSYFTHHLLWGLRGAADFDQDQRVTLGEAYRYAYRATVDGTWHTLAGRQHPTIELMLDQRGSVPLTDLRIRDASVRFGAELHGTFALLEPGGASILAEVRKPRDHVQRLAVAAGSYWVAERRGERIWIQSLTIPPGGEASVDPASMVDHTAVVEAARKAGRGKVRGPLQMLVGYGLSSGALGTSSAMHHGMVGLRVDMGHFSIVPRFVYGATSGVGDLPTANTRRFTVRGLGLETWVLMRYEVSLLDLFAGLNLGFAWLDQRLEQDAPASEVTHEGPAWVVGLAAGLDVPIASGWSAHLFWELDEWIYRRTGRSDPSASLHVKGAVGLGHRF